MFKRLSPNISVRGGLNLHVCDPLSVTYIFFFNTTLNKIYVHTFESASHRKKGTMNCV